MRTFADGSDSRTRLAGFIPGAPRTHACALTGPRPSAIPVLIAVPHAGRTYPESLLRALRDPDAAALRLEDRLVDKVGHAVADRTGAMLLVAAAPRAMIDLNRAPDDVDWDMFGRDDRPREGRHAPTRRARSGLGIIPRRVPGIGELWKYNHSKPDLMARIAGIHEPYHAMLSESLAELRSRWGAAVLLDLHSMPTIRPRGAALPPEFVLGDRCGAACHGSLVAAISSLLHEHDRIFAHNRPYSGGYGLEKHADPRNGIHGLQLEIDRGAYLNRGFTDLGPGFGKLVDLLTALVREVAVQVTMLGDSPARFVWRDAAE